MRVTSTDFIGFRVELPSYCSHWLAGDRFGTVIGTMGRAQVRVRLDGSNRVSMNAFEDCRMLGRDFVEVASAVMS